MGSPGTSGPHHDRSSAPSCTYWFMKARSPIFARSSITRHDAAVSIRRAYRPQELQRIAAEAGLRGARVYTCFPYRLILVIDHAEPGSK